MGILFRIFLGLVLLLPLPFGAVPTWAWSLMAVASALLLLAWSALVWRSGNVPPVSFSRIWPAAALFGIVIVWSIAQTATWTPAAWHHPLWTAAGDALDRPLPGRISLDPFESYSTILRLVAYAAIFWLALQFCRDRERAHVALKTFTVAAGVYTAYAVAVQISGTNTILWFNKTRYLDVATGTFLNRNTFATYAGIGVLALTARLVQVLEDRLPRSLSFRDSARQAMILLLQRHWPLLTGFVVAFGALLMSESRGGLVSCLAGLTVMVLALAARRVGRRKIALRTGLAMLAASLLLIFTAGQGVIDRIGASQGKLDARGPIYDVTNAAIEQSPLLGTGLGSFPGVYRLYNRGEVGTAVLRAHNTYLEYALELGWPGAAAQIGVVFLLTLACLKGVWHRERDTVYPVLGLSVSVLVGVHSMIDFSLQIPAIAATFAFLMGLGCAQSWSTARR